MIAGWAFSVRTKSLSGPSHISRESFCCSASSTSSKTSRALANASASALPMPTAWLPCPGKMKARAIGVQTVGVKIGRETKQGGAPKSSQEPLNLVDQGGLQEEDFV